MTCVHIVYWSVTAINWWIISCVCGKTMVFFVRYC